MKLFSKILFVNWGHLRVTDWVLCDLHGVQHRLGVGWVQLKHYISDNAVDDFIRFIKPLHITHVYRQIFEKNLSLLLAEDPGPRREQHTHRVEQGVVHFLYDTCL